MLEAFIFVVLTAVSCLSCAIAPGVAEQIGFAALAVCCFLVALICLCKE